MAKRRKYFELNEPLRHSHRPMTRRGFISQGFATGMGSLLGVSALSVLSGKANAISPAMLGGFTPGTSCDLANVAGRKIPFICFDLAGGANISGSNVLVGGPGGQQDFLSTAGYSKLGLPGDMIPSIVDTVTGNSDFVNEALGLAFHSDSAMLRGILASASSVATQTGTNGAVIPCRSDNDTGNNPHNPMYGIYRAGAKGKLLQLIGSQTSESGGNSMAAAAMIDPQARPTKIDRPSDVIGLVDVGDLSTVLPDSEDVVAVLESMKQITDQKLGQVDTQLGSTKDLELKQRISCEYLKSADSFEKFSDPSALDPNPSADSNIASIFTQAEFDNDREFRKTASVMKMVIDGHAAAGTITMGGYDYHTGDRVTGELRDERAGRCIGACLEYAQLVDTPVMIYVFSDGSVASNGQLDMNLAIPKGQWTGDNSSTGASFFLVYNPSGRPQLNTSTGLDAFQHQQIGYMRPDASVETSANAIANSVDTLAEAVVLNYMALHGSNDISQFDAVGSIFADSNKKHGLGTDLDRYIAFEPIVDGTL
ncbi:MAG: general secretion pathway protein GspF [Spongiibacteraceae bacterium]|nr:general secretion pathway protein GspF [Spongiibacteraceae bacterium]